QCDLKKHMKRHTKPYACTFPRCFKHFGSKSDWKRHENSQHFQIETWRCPVQTSSQVPNPCAQLFHRRDEFESHLKQKHRIQKEVELEKLAKENRIGRNGQVGFWCGFHRRIIPLMQRGVAAWDERFNHTDHHFNVDKFPIDEWICLENNMKIGDISKNRNES